MQIQFQTGGKALPNHVADFDIVFEEGVLNGLKLVGGALWSSKDGRPDLRVTLPAHKIVAEGKERYFDLLRAIDKNAQTIRDFKAAVVTAYRAHLRSA